MQLARFGLAVACATVGYLARVGLEPGARAAPAEVARPAAPMAVCARNISPAAPRDTERDPAPEPDEAVADEAVADDAVADDAGQDLAEVLAHAAAAQPTYENRIHGVVTDGTNGEPLAGATVIATSPAMAQSRTAITDERGDWTLTDLPPGNYTLTFYYAEITVERSNLALGSLTALELPQQLSEPPRIDEPYLREIPVPSRTFEEALGAASGSQGDSDGVSFSSADTLENTYYVDGVAVE